MEVAIRILEIALKTYLSNEGLVNLTKKIYEGEIKQLRIELHKIEAEHAAVTKAY